MFENLNVYQKSINIAEQILIASFEFPRGYSFLTDQLNHNIGTHADRVCGQLLAMFLHATIHGEIKHPANYPITSAPLDL